MLSLYLIAIFCLVSSDGLVSVLKQNRKRHLYPRSILFIATTKTPDESKSAWRVESTRAWM